MMICALRVAFFAALTAVSLMRCACAGERPLAVGDLMKLSDIGNAIARPGSNDFVWEQSPPYDRLVDYAAGSTGTWQGSDFEIFTVDPVTKRPRRLFETSFGTTYRLGSFSKDGRFLTLVSMRTGEVRLAVYDYRLHSLKEFAVAPRFPPLQPAPDWFWLDERRLAVAACPAGEGPWQLTFRRSIGARLSKSWAKSWKGKEASVDRYDSFSTDVVTPLPGRLLIVDVVSGHIKQLASGQFSGLRVSPDGRWLAAVRQSLLPQATLQQPHLDWTNARSALTLFSLTRPFRRRDVMPELDVLPDSVVWSPSGGGLAFYAFRSGENLRSGNFWIVDPLNSLVREVSHAGLSLASQRVRGGPQWPERPVWLDDSLAVFAHPAPGQPGTMAFEDIKNDGIVDPRAEMAFVTPHWFLLAPEAAPLDLTPGLQDVSPLPVVSDKSLLIVLGDGQAWRVHPSQPPDALFPESSQRLLPLAHQDFISLARSNGGGGMVSLVGGPGSVAQVTLNNGLPGLRILTTPPESAVVALSNSDAALVKIGSGKHAELAVVYAGGKRASLGELNPSLDDVAETKWMEFKYDNFEGSKRSQLSGCLLLPIDYHTDRKYPLIVEVYPGRSGGCAAPRAGHIYAMGAHPTSYSEHLLAARGFIVFEPDTAGGIIRSPEGPLAQLSQVVDRGIDSVLAAGYGDSDRVGLLGYSQGGFAALWIATQSSRYKAVVSLNGWSDLASSFFGMNWTQELAPTEIPPEGDVGRYVSSAGSEFSMGGTPWQVPQRYIRNSPLWRSDAVSAPILLIHSDMDAFDDGSYKAFFTSLYTQKKSARLLIYRGEGHSPSSPANIRDMWRNIFSWFDVNLRIKRNSDGAIVFGG